jgi:hypothetical protein
MDAIVAALITAVVGGPIFYALGTRQRRLEGLYERRAQVIARLSELLFVMQRGLGTWANPVQSVGVDRDAQRTSASDALQELVHYYHSNAVWLDPQTCEKIESVMDAAWTAAWDYADELNERGYTHNETGRNASRKLYSELPVLRRDLEDQFRAILYPPPWYDAPLRVLERIHARNRRNSAPGPDTTDDDTGEADRSKG